MRNLILASTVFALVGCGSHVDGTMNRTGDPSSSSAVDYPAGPYGYKEGRVIENLEFTGKIPVNAGTDYASLQMQKITMNDFRKDPAVKLVYIVGSARWCVPCNDEQPLVRDLGEKYKAQG